MLRQSLTLFVLLVLVSLGLVVAYAFLGLSGPETTIAEAQDALRAGRYAEAERLCNIASKSTGLQGNTELRRKLYDVRFQAHKQLDNMPRALEDLDALLALDGPRDPALQLERVRILIAIGDADRALSGAENLLSADAGNGELLQLRGEARQLLYQNSLRQLVASIDRELTGTLRDRALRSLRDHIYRPSDDPKVLQGKADLLQYLQDQGATTRNTSFESDLAATRQNVQDCLEDYRRALETEGQPTSAYQGMAYALREGGRTDDLICLAEIYLQRFNHIYATQAAVDLVGAHMAAGRPRAAVEAADRFLANWRDRLRDNRLHRDVRFLLLQKLQAHMQLGEKKQTRDTMGIAVAVHNVLGIAPEMRLLVGLHQESLGNDEEAAKALESFLRSQGRTAAEVPIAGEDLVALTLRHLAEVGAADDRDEIHARWINLRRDFPEPWVARARFRLARGQFAGAYEDAKQALRRSSEDEVLLQLVARTADEHYEATDRHGKGLLAQCHKARRESPDTSDPIGYLLCARAARDNRDWEIMLESARKASDHWLWALEPRLLYAQAAMRLERFEEAVVSLQTARRFHGDDPRLLRALRDATTANNGSTQSLLVDTMRTIPAEPGVSEDLLRRTLETGPPEALPVLARRALEFENAPATLLSVAAQAAARGGDLATSQDAVQRLQKAQAAARLQLPAQAERLRAKALSEPDALLVREAEQLLPLAADDPAGLAQIAAELRLADRPAAALTLLRAVLDEGESDQRTGANYALAGQLALQLRDRRTARDYLTAAVTFDDGASAAIPLAMLFLDAGDETNAALATDLRGRGDPLPIALTWRLGRTRVAIEQALARLQVDRYDMPAQAIHAVGLAENCPDPDLQQLAKDHAEALADAALWIDHVGFEDRALTSAQALADKAPTSVFAQLLLAKALGNAGQKGEAMKRLAALSQLATPPWPLHHVTASLVATGDPTILTPALQEMILAGVTKPEGQIRPTQAVVAARLLAARALRAGFRDAALEASVQAWRQFPVESQVRIPDVQLLFGLGRVAEALEILGAMEPTITKAQRPASITEYFLCAGYLALRQDNQIVRDIARARARRFIDEEGHWSPAVQFLFLEEEARLGPLLEDRREDSDVRRLRHARWAHGIIDFHLDGNTQSASGLEWALNMISILDGDDAASERIEALLQLQPGSRTLWHLRTLLHHRMGKTAQAVADLRNVGDYLPDSRLAANRAVIAAAAGLERPRDRDDLVKTAGAELDRPDVRLGLGLLDLRIAAFARADDHLAHAPMWGGGARDYFRAMAKLGMGGEQNLADAAELFAKIATDHPGQPQLANAAHFAAQLGVPRVP